MKREEYKMALEKMFNTLPKKDTPKGQKFNIGDVVRIANPIHWYSKEYTKDQLFEVQYSYYQKYGGIGDRNKKEYSLKHLFEDNSSAWYEEEELELVQLNKEESK